MLHQKFSKIELYIACQEDGYVLPKLTSTAVRMQYLFNVREGLEYCPHQDEVRIDLDCLNPPKKIILLQIIFELLKQKGDQRDLSFDEKHMPDVDWCLQAISALDPDHPIFEPGYKPATHERGRRGRKFVALGWELVRKQDHQQKGIKMPYRESLCGNIQFNSQERKIHSNAQQNPKQEVDQRYYDQKSQLNKDFQNYQKSLLGSSIHKGDERNSKSYTKKSHPSIKTQPSIQMKGFTKQRSKQPQIDTNRFAEEPFETQQTVNIQNIQSPLERMLRALEKKGLLDEYFEQFINRSEQQQEEQNVVKIVRQVPPQKYEKMSMKSEHSKQTEEQFENVHFLQDQKDQKNKGQLNMASEIVNHEEVKEEEECKHDTFNQVIKKRSINLMLPVKNQQPVLIQKVTMNKLLDESSFNPAEYEEVVFHDPTEQEKEEDNQQFEGNKEKLGNQYGFSYTGID